MQSRAASTSHRKFTYRPPPADHRFAVARNPSATLPGDVRAALPSVDWRHLLTPVRDQQRREICYAFAACGLKEFNCSVWGGAKAPLGGWLSPEYVGWRVGLDQGGSPDDGSSCAESLSVVQRYGIPPEGFLPVATAATPGDAACDVAALPYRIAGARNVPIEPDTLKRELSNFRVLMIGFSVYESFERTGRDGIVPQVIPGEGLLGGHAVLVVGYDARGWIFRNSWSASWGDLGYGYFPYGYETHWMECMTDP